MLVGGGRTARPTRSIDGSRNPRNVFIPPRSLFKSVHAGSGLPFESVHIEPVRSRTSITSSGFSPHGEHAVAVAWTVRFETPNRPPNTIGTSAVARTTTAFAGEHPGTDARHFVEKAI